MKHISASSTPTAAAKPLRAAAFVQPSNDVEHELSQAAGRSSSSQRPPRDGAAAFRTIFAQVSPEEIAAQGTTSKPCSPVASTRPLRSCAGRKKKVLALSHLPSGPLAPDLEHQSARTPQQGDQAPQPGRRDLSQRGSRHPTLWCRGARHQRRVGRVRASLLLRRLHGRSLPTAR